MGPPKKFKKYDSRTGSDRSGKLRFYFINYLIMITLICSKL